VHQRIDSPLWIIAGLKDDDFGINSSLMWLRDTDRGLPPLNFPGIGVSPWMQPRVDPSMMNYQTDVYQAMAAAALQDMWTSDPSKQHPTSLLQFQQPQNFLNRTSTLVHTQILQQSQSQQSFPNGQEIPHPSQSQAQSLTHFQQHQHSFNNQNQNQHHLLQQQQQQQQSQQPQQQQQQQQVVDHQQIPSAVSTMSQFVSAPQSQSPPMQAISSLGHQQSFSDSNGNPVTNAIVSPLHSILGSFSQDETSHLLNLPRTTWVPVQPSTAWPPSKRVAVDPLLSSGASQCVLPQVEQLGQPQSTMAQNAITLPPFPSRECAIEGSTDPQNHLLFGVNIEPSSLLMHNGLSSLKGVSSNSGPQTIPFQSSNYLNTTGTDSSMNPGMTHNIGEAGFLQTPENGGQGNPPIKTFVKVSFSSGCIFFQIKCFIFFSLLCFSDSQVANY